MTLFKMKNINLEKTFLNKFNLTSGAKSWLIKPVLCQNSISLVILSVELIAFQTLKKMISIHFGECNLFDSTSLLNFTENLLILLVSKEFFPPHDIEIL